MIAVIGCGNANRSDDAAGLEVVRLLKELPSLAARSDLRMLDAGTDGMSVMFAARGCTTLIVVDCCRSGADPGEIFEVPGHEVESRPNHSLNLHDFRWDHALHAGRRIFRDSFPRDVTAYLIEGRNFDLGLGLSPDIGKAAAAVADKIERRIMALPVGRAFAGAGTS